MSLETSLTRTSICNGCVKLLTSLAWSAVVHAVELHIRRVQPISKKSLRCEFMFSPKLFLRRSPRLLTEVDKTSHLTVSKLRCVQPPQPSQRAYACLTIFKLRAPRHLANALQIPVSEIPTGSLGRTRSIPILGGMNSLTPRIAFDHSIFCAKRITPGRLQRMRSYCVAPCAVRKFCAFPSSGARSFRCRGDNHAPDSPPAASPQAVLDHPRRMFARWGKLGRAKPWVAARCSDRRATQHRHPRLPPTRTRP